MKTSDIVLFLNSGLLGNIAETAFAVAKAATPIGNAVHIAEAVYQIAKGTKNIYDAAQKIREDKDVAKPLATFAPLICSLQASLIK